MERNLNVKTKAEKDAMIKEMKMEQSIRKEIGSAVKKLGQINQIAFRSDLMEKKK